MRRAGTDRDARRASERRGARAELVAAAALMLKGYRVLARRWKCRHGEIDLVAVRGRRLAFVEVKQRTTAEDAHAAIGELQSHRIRDAAELWLARERRYRGHDIHFDAVFVLPRRWPMHVEDAM